MKGHVCRVALLILATWGAPRAFADLIPITDVSGLAFAVAPANALVTIHSNSNGLESGCINLSGAYSSCLNNGVTQILGGNNVGLNSLLTLTTDQTIVAVIKLKDANGQAGTLTDIYLLFNSATGSHLVEYVGPDIFASAPLLGFRLSDADFAAVQALGSSVTVAGGLAFATGTTTGGPETMYVAALQQAGLVGSNGSGTGAGSGAGGGSGAAVVSTPEPGTFILLGTGLAAVIWIGRGKSRRRTTTSA